MSDGASISARPQPPLLSALAVLAILGTGLYGTWFWLTVDEGPPAEAIAEAANALRAEHQPGDLIFLVPNYATRAREYLGDLSPLAVQDPLLEDFAVHPRAWVFGLFGAAEALRPRMERAGHTLERTLDLGVSGVTVDLYRTYADQRTVFSFTGNLDRAKVWHEKRDGNTPCSRWLPSNGQGGRFGRWSCPYDQEWFYVAPEWHRMGDHLRFCLWAHPPNQGRLVIRYPDVPLGGTLFGRAGHTLNSHHHARAPVFLDVAVGDEAPQRFAFDLEDHFRPFLVPTSTTGTATVTFAVSTPDAGANHFCFDAETRREVAP